MGLRNYLLNKIETHSEKKFKEREGQLAIAKAERLENRLSNMESENKKEIQKIHNDYADFLGIVAHDLTGPLGNIQGFSELYEQGEIEAQLYFHQLKNILKTANKAKDLLTIVGDSLPRLKEKSKNLNVSKVFLEFYNGNKTFLDKENIKVDATYDEMQLNVPEPILNCIIANSVGDSFNHAISYVHFSTSSDKDHIIYKIENDTDGTIKRRIHGEGNGKGRPFLKHLIEKIYHGKFELTQENGKYSSLIYLPKEHVQVKESKS